MDDRTSAERMTIRQAGPTLPPRLERYVPPDLWRKLNTETPRRGVLLHTLERLRSLLYLLSTHLPRHLVQETMRRPVAGRVRGRWVEGSLLFADVSGFTALSERLAALGQEGAERLTDLINAYFARMIQILDWSGGILLKFAGDALLAYFAGQEDGEHARWAVRCALRMMRAMSEFAEVDTLDGSAGLRMKIGIGSGSFLAASVGTAERMEYVVLGETVARTMAAEGAAQAGLVVVDGMTVGRLGAEYRRREVADGFWAVSPGPDLILDEFEIKVERRRARGVIPWNAKPHAIVARIEIVLRQIEALLPYLPPGLAEQVIAQSKRRRVESEFRPTAVIFVNLLGLEPLLAAWGPSGVRRVTDLLNGYFCALQRIVGRHGGSINHVDPYDRGSKILILFGTPTAHEDDPLRAVEAALAMHKEVARLNDRWHRKLARYLPPGTEAILEQRSGITHGLVFVGQVGAATRREYTVMGDDVNLAARLMSAAAPGQILINRRVYDAVAEQIATVALPPIRVKGKSRPIAVYRPLAPRDDPLGFRLRRRGPLIDRRTEMKQVRAVLDRLPAGRGGILTVAGPPGVGKSHLADHLIALALAQGCRVLFAHCTQAPYVPWADLLRSWTGIGPADDGIARYEKLRSALADLGLDQTEIAEPLGDLLAVERPRPPQTERAAATPPPSSDLFERLAQAVTGEEGQEPEINIWQLLRRRGQGAAGQMWRTLQERTDARQQARLVGALVAWLMELAAQQPLLLFLEDADRLDSSSWEVIRALEPYLAQGPVLLLLAERCLEGESPVEVGQTLTLGPLDREATAHLVEHLWGGPPDAEVVATVYARSGGNPLFITELINWMRHHDRETKDRPIPLSLQELALGRIDVLPPAQRDIIRRAAVVGSEFTVDDLRALLPPEEQGETLQKALAELEKARLIAQADGAGRYTFRQTLIREVVYRSQPPARRRELHARLAAYLEKRYAADPLANAELLAYHYEQGDRPLPAARYLILSGAKARARGAYSQAVDCFERAIRALDRLPEGEEVALLRAIALEGRSLQGRRHPGI